MQSGTTDVLAGKPPSMKGMMDEAVLGAGFGGALGGAFGHINTVAPGAAAPGVSRIAQEATKRSTSTFGKEIAKSRDSAEETDAEGGPNRDAPDTEK